MESPIFESFFQDRARSGSSDLCINLIPEHVDGQKAPQIGLLISSPGLTTPLATVGTGPVREAFPAKNGLMYVVSGSGLYSVDTLWNATLLGNVGSSAGPVSIIESPTQILVVDGTGGWVWDFVATTFTQTIPNADTDCIAPNVAVYQDGFGLVNSLHSNQIYQSNYNDLSQLAALVGGGGATANNAFVQGNPKDVLTMYDLKEEVFIFKSNGIEVWINQGNPGFAFTQLQGVYFPVGIVAPASIARAGDGLVFLGGSDEGGGVVLRTSGYQSQSIMTHALAQEFQDYPVISDAIAYTYQADAHFYYVITFPTANKTWAYDFATGKWTQRAYFSNGAFSRELVNCHALFNNMHVVGDYQNGNLYTLDDSTYTDNGAPRKWVRSWRALPSAMPQGVPMSFDSLQILLETGITVPDGMNPMIDLRFSDDGGYTWNGPFQIAAGKTGQTSWRAIQNRLGSTTIGRGLDRVWEISGNDPIGIKICGAEWTGGPA
jgi:hypothetical protein